MYIETPAEGNGQGRTAINADALETSCDARLYLSKGFVALHNVEGLRMAKCHPSRNFFRPRRYPLSHDSKAEVELELKRIPQCGSARSMRQSAKGLSFDLNVVGE